MAFARTCSFIWVTYFVLTTVNSANVCRLSGVDADDLGDNNQLVHPTTVASLKHYAHTVTVQHFARHGLCGGNEGKQYFYTALKSKLCHIQEIFTSNLVEDLCKQRGLLLDRWASELFDIDGDGILTHFERVFYNSDE